MMAGVPCPSCQSVSVWMSHDGRCVACHSPLPKTHQKGRERLEALPPSKGIGPCRFCLQTGADVRVRFLMVIVQGLSAVKTALALASVLDGADAVNRKTVILETPCCDDCGRKGRRIQTVRWYTMPVWGTLPATVAFGLLIFIGIVFEPKSPVVEVMGLSLLAVLVGGWIYGCIRTASLTRQRIADLLDPGLNARLKEFAGVKDWGFWNGVLLTNDSVLDKELQAPFDQVFPEFADRRLGRPAVAPKPSRSLP